MRITKRIYHDRQPRVGDTIIALRNDRYGNYSEGNELIITKMNRISGTRAVFAYNKRTGAEICISDGFYRIYSDITYEKTGEQHVVKRLFGIPFYKKTTDIYEEV